MAQAYINCVIQHDKHFENQIQELRKHSEYSDCDEELLVQAADEIEKKHLKENRKRKLKPYEDIERKRLKLEENAFICDLCDKAYKHKRTLNRHIQSHFVKFECKTCDKSFTQKSSLKRHKDKCDNSKFTKCSATENKNVTKKEEHKCKHCGIPFNDYDSLFHHVTAIHPLNQYGGDVARDPPNESDTVTENQMKSDQKRFRFKKSAMNETALQTSIVPYGDEKYDLLQFLANVRGDVDKELNAHKAKQRNIKWYVNAKVEMVRDIEDGNQEKAHPHFRSKSYISLTNENNDHNLNEAFQAINKALEEFINKGSNWILNKIICLEVNTVKYSPIAGSSYIELPQKIKFTGGIINIKNDDQKCFLWSILAALHPAPNNQHQVYHYKPFETQLNMTGIDYPVSLAKIEKFEKQNKISVNVFGFEEGEVFPLYLTKLQNGHVEVDLLYLATEEKTHYCWIKNLDRFLGSMTRFCNKRFYCRRCLHGFTRKDLLDDHKVYCNQFSYQKVEYPQKGKELLSFKDYEKQIRVPFVVYADFECYAQKVDTCPPNQEKPSTTHRTKYEACGYSYVVVSSNDEYSKPPVVYRGPDAVKHFFDDMLKEEEYINEKLSQIEPLIMSDETENAFKNATNCYVCNRLFTDKLIKVRDHDHLGVKKDTEAPYTNYRGAACQSCNLNLQHPSFIPIFFHNLRGFDMHLLMSKAGEYKDKKLNVIAQNTERYISFSLGKLRFLDTYQFMSSSLETLVDNLAADGLTHFKQFRKSFPNDDIAKLLLQKNEYCYDYVDCEEKFSDTKLPPKEAFYNSLTKEHISESKYKHAQIVWNTLNMKNLGNFHDTYVLTDTLLLCDVFERFRDMTLQYYKLDAAWFYTSPGIAWQSALKMSGITLELLTNPFMFHMFEISTRGGVSMVTKKHCHANHLHLDDFDNSKESKHIMYLDSNNLYGWAMSQPLPTGLMRFLSEEEIESFNLQKIAPDSKEGYILEVDLIYPPHIHDEHNCYPLAPTHKLITDEKLSPYSQNLWRKLNGNNKSRVKTTKLIPTLEDKSHYIVHYQNLQLYEKLGLKIAKIHRILSFHQSPWLKTYIDFNANKRKHAKNDFEKDFFKLMCNSVFGKCLENIRDRINFKLVSSPESLQKYASKPSFERFQIFNDNLVGVLNKKVNLVLNKPIYVGQAILDLSKKLMYDFHYRVMKPMYGDKISLLFTDTDSLCYEIHTKDVYKDMQTIAEHLDTSNYPKDHPLFCDTYKKIPGYFKDEMFGTPIKEFVALRPKMYAFTYDTVEKNENGEKITLEKEKKVAKGIARCEIKKTLKHQMYKECLFGESVTMNSMNMIRSKNHELYMDTIVKKGLCSLDDKRFWINKIDSYAFGHYKIPKYSKHGQ